MIIRICKAFCLVYFTVLIASCGSTKELQYLQGSFDTAKLSNYQIPEPIIQKNDLLGITVYSDNPEATAIYNQLLPSGGGVSGALAEDSKRAGNSSSMGYLVDQSGNIQFQSIGSLHVEGLTRKGLTELLDSNLKTYLKNPYYDIRFLNYKITVIGDVAKPSVYSIPGERINVLEALGLAGDLNITARRDNVLVIREQNGKREFGRIDLTKPDLLNSPFYQLKQNDIVYVDLSKNKAAINNERTIRYISIGTSIVSTIAILITVFRK